MTVEIESEVKANLSQFGCTTLCAMNEVALLDRMDTKFAFRVADLPALLSTIRSDYRVLTIRGVSIHRYETGYWDTPDLALYLRHHNGFYPRHKFRFRQYADLGEGFFEVKEKTNKGRTLKRRVKQNGVPRVLEGEARALVERAVPTLHRKLQPTLWVYFNRITLVNRFSPERITLDSNLSFRTDVSRREFPGLAIAEIKRDRCAARSTVASALQARRHTAGSISKYCLGVATLFPTVRVNLFKEKLKEIMSLAG
jgi:hypothetical protein